MWKNLPRYKSKNNIAYYKVGKGPDLLLIHGVGLKAESYSAQIKYFSENYTVFAIDLPGHGTSDNIKIYPKNLDSYIYEVELFIDEIINNSFIIIGHSFGALIAINYAKQHKKNCTGIIALNCIYQRSDEALKKVKLRLRELKSENMNKEIELTIVRWFGKSPKGYLNEISNICRQWLLESNKEGYLNAYDVFANQRGIAKEVLKKIQVPITFITGSKDLNSTTLMSKSMANFCFLGAFNEIKGAGHMAMMSHSDEVNRAIDSFITMKSK